MNILTKYYADVQSFPLSQARMGMFGPGRYSGFDQIIAGTGATDIPIKLKHSTAGLKQTDNTNTQTDYIGTVMTPHGVVINTVDVTDLVISKNQGGWTQGDAPEVAKDRYDLIYLEYWWADEDPGNDPFVGVIEGTAGAGIPSLTQPKVQIALGVVFVPYGAGSFSDLVYTPSIIPYLAGREIISQNPQFDLRFARLNYPNTFNGTQNTTPIGVSITPTSSYTLQLPKTYGNTFIINCNGLSLGLAEVVDADGEQFPVGTRLTLFFKNCPTTSKFLMSTDGHHPGFEWNGLSLGPVGTQYPIRPGYGYEVENYKGRTWRMVNAFDYVAYSIITLKQQVTALQAGYITPTPFRIIPEHAAAEVDSFEVWGFSNYMEDGERLRYRINKGGDLEITGQFGFQAVPYPYPANQTWVKLFTLDPNYNPQRSLQFMAYGSGILDPTLTTYHKKMKIDLNGAVWISIKNSFDFGSYSVNAIISIAQSAGGVGQTIVIGGNPV